MREDGGKATDVEARSRWQTGEGVLGATPELLLKGRGGTGHWLEEQRLLATAVSEQKREDRAGLRRDRGAALERDAGQRNLRAPSLAPWGEHVQVELLGRAPRAWNPLVRRAARLRGVAWEWGAPGFPERS